jgi:SAM-dependent methyltransferase/uncharacterized protein YbaR (Trm112 family)
MKTTLLRLLVCPVCGEELTCEPWSTSSSGGGVPNGAEPEIVEGLLACACGLAFPIIAGVPRMLLGALREQLWTSFRAFFRAHRGRLPAGLTARGDASASAVEVRTQRSFGYEWTKFSDMRPEWEPNYWGYMAPHGPEFLGGKVVLDAGCGMGRHLHFTARHAGEAIGVDFSKAVDAAHRNTRELPRAHVVQADLKALPFRRDAFDFIYSLGVLQHLPAPEKAFAKLLTHLRPAGEARVYLYWSREGAPRWSRALLTCVAGLRRVTTRLPHGLLLGLCYPIAAAAWISLVLPSGLLARFRGTRGLAETMPLRQYSAYPFGVLVNDQFDRFAAPLERRYRAEEVRRLLEGAGLREVSVRPYAGWLGHGWKAAGEEVAAPAGEGREARAAVALEGSAPPSFGG